MASAKVLVHDAYTQRQATLALAAEAIGVSSAATKSRPAIAAMIHRCRAPSPHGDLIATCALSSRDDTSSPA